MKLLNMNLNNGQKRIDLEEGFPIIRKEEYGKKYSDTKTFRPFGPCWVVKYHLIEGRNKDGTKKWFKMVPCVNWDIAAGKEVHNDCPFCKVGIPMQNKLYVNCIDLEAFDPNTLTAADRSDKEKVPVDFDGTKFFVKDPKSRSKTPVKLLSLGPALIRFFLSLSSGNVVKMPDGRKEIYDICDLKYGRPIQIIYDKERTFKDRYQCQISMEEPKYPIPVELRKMLLIHDFSAAAAKIPSVEELTKDLLKDLPRITNASNKGALGGMSEDDVESQSVSTDVDDIDTPSVSYDDDDDTDVATRPVEPLDDDEIPF